MLSSDDVHRFVRHHLDGKLSTASLRTLLVAVRPSPTDAIAPVIATVLALLDEPTEATRRERLAKFVEEQSAPSPPGHSRP